MILLACAPKQPITIDQNLVPYFEMFQNTIGVSTADVSGRMDELVLPTIGVCTVDESGNKVVHIDATYWNASNDDAREMLVFHELGHCAMGRVHDVAVDKYGCPLSIMYPHDFPDKCFEVNRQAYYAEMISYK